MKRLSLVSERGHGVDALGRGDENPKQIVIEAPDVECDKFPVWQSLHAREKSGRERARAGFLPLRRAATSRARARELLACMASVKIEDVFATVAKLI